MEELPLDVEDRFGECSGILLGDLQEVVGQPGGCLGADARQARELADKSSQWVAQGQPSRPVFRAERRLAGSPGGLWFCQGQMVAVRQHAHRDMFKIHDSIGPSSEFEEFV